MAASAVKVSGSWYSGSRMTDAAAVGRDRSGFLKGEGAVFFQKNGALAQMASETLDILYFMTFGSAHIFLLAHGSLSIFWLLKIIINAGNAKQKLVCYH